jgi:hypothetical protein
MEALMKRDAVTRRLIREITAASQALLDRAQEDPDRWWPAYELKDAARNGWSAGAMNMALTRLIDGERFEVKGDRIRLRH